MVRKRKEDKMDDPVQAPDVLTPPLFDTNGAANAPAEEAEEDDVADADDEIETDPGKNDEDGRDEQENESIPDYRPGSPRLFSSPYRPSFQRPQFPGGPEQQQAYVDPKQRAAALDEFMASVATALGETETNKGFIAVKRMEERIGKDGVRGGWNENFKGYLPIRTQNLLGVIHTRYGWGEFNLYPTMSNKKIVDGIFQSIFIEPNGEEKETLRMKEEMEKMEAEIKLESQKADLRRKRREAEREEKMASPAPAAPIPDMKELFDATAKQNENGMNMFMKMLELQRTSEERAREERKHEIAIIEKRIEAEREKYERDRFAREEREEKARLAREEREERDRKERDLERERQQERLAGERKRYEDEAKSFRDQMYAEQQRRADHDKESLALQAKIIQSSIEKDQANAQQISAMILEHAKSSAAMLSSQMAVTQKMVENQIDMMGLVSEQLGLEKKEEESQSVLGTVAKGAIEIFGKMYESKGNGGIVAPPMVMPRQAVQAAPASQSIQAPKQSAAKSAQKGDRLTVFRQIVANKPEVIQKFLAAMAQNYPVAPYVGMIREFGDAVTVALIDVPWSEIAAFLVEAKAQDPKTNQIIPLLSAETATLVKSNKASEWWDKFQTKLKQEIIAEEKEEEGGEEDE